MCGGTPRKFTANAFDALVHERVKNSLHVSGGNVAHVEDH